MTQPGWLSALQADEALAARFGLGFLEQDQHAPMCELAHRAWQGKHGGELAAAGHARIERAIPIGAGLPRRRRVSGTREAVILWLDPADDQLFAGFTLLYPPALWLPLGTTGASVEAALAPYDVDEPAPVPSLPCVRRWLKQVDPSQRDRVEQVCAQWEPWLDDASWASAHADDPWSAWPLASDAGELSAQRAQAAEEKPGRIASTSYRTLWSRSVLTIEYHPFHGVFAARHAPVAPSLPRFALADLVGDTVPPDVPLDVVASLLRSGNVTLAHLHRLRDTWEPWHEMARCALLPGEPVAGLSLRERFDEVKGDPTKRALLVQLALYYRHHWVLLDIACAEPELARAPDLAPYFRQILPSSVIEAAP